MNLFSALQAAYTTHLQQIAIETDNGLSYTWQDIENASAMLANFLTSLELPRQQGLPPVIASHTDKSVETLLLYLATLRAGYVYLPLNPAYKQDEMSYFIQDAKPAVLVCRPDEFQALSRIAFQKGVNYVFTLSQERTGSLLNRALHHSPIQQPIANPPHHPAAILYTSGTTGRSKGALLTHSNLLSNAVTLLSAWDWQPDDVLLHALPIFHIHGLFVACHCALLSASRLFWLNKFTAPGVLQHLAASTVFMGVPTMYSRLLADPHLDAPRCAHMRLFISGSAPLLTSTFEEFTQRTGHTILERYGMSETGMICSNPYRASDGARIAGSVGPALPSIQVRTVDEQQQPCPTDAIGHIEVKGPNVFQGYLNQPEKTREAFTADSWFRTGDIGRLDAQQYLHIVGRARDLIISGGFNIYPSEVESYLNQLNGVQESAVVGIPHPDFGEAVVAFIVPKASEQLSESAIITEAKERIANFKVPKRVFFVPELPRNAMGKIQKNQLQKEHSQLFKTSSHPI